MNVKYIWDLMYKKYLVFTNQILNPNYTCYLKKRLER